MTSPNETVADIVSRWAVMTQTLVDEEAANRVPGSPRREGGEASMVATSTPPEEGAAGVASAINQWAIKVAGMVDAQGDAEAEEPIGTEPSSDTDPTSPETDPAQAVVHRARRARRTGFLLPRQRVQEQSVPASRSPEADAALFTGDERADAGLEHASSSPTLAAHLGAIARRARDSWRWTAWRIALVSVVGCVLLAGVGWMVAQQMTALPGDAAFEVDGQVVTVSSYTRQLAVLEALYGVKVPSGAKAAASFRRAAAQAMAVQMIVARAARHAGVHVTEKAAQDQLQQDVSQQYSQGFSSFVSQLGARGLSEGEVRQAVSQEMALERLFNRVVGTVHPSTAQLEQLYRQHRAALAVPETRTIAHIVVSSRSEAQSIMSQLQGGASFATLAAEDSLDKSTAANGGQLGTLSQAELTPAFGKAAFAAQVNVPFGPVHDADGWEVGLVTNVVPGHATSFSQARTELEDYVVVRTEQARWTRWLDTQLRSAGLRFAAPFRPAHPDVAPKATLPTLGPPEAVGSVPAGSSSGASSGQGASSAPGATSVAEPGSSPATSGGQ